ncbi:MAG: glycoside hydrolase family 38 C-terminal domain-containing protein [Candidatus Aminicenantes bacterium]|jgi:alpha-mannosidase
MSLKKLYLICNAHLDPVWLWEWEEGAAEALSTFRTAAQLCEEFEEFVFCHNESLLYRWVEMYEPELFKKIQDLVKKRRWHIMGGWYVQPDCNMPSGESFVRQILVGKTYFEEKFGVEPKTAINFDPFGHTRGLVQVLKKSGYTSYVFCRPDPKELELPADDFLWIGYDGSEILAHRAPDHYNSERGKARQRVEKWLAENLERPAGLLLWGIGDHGGGASREDLIDLRELSNETRERQVQHGTPEAYFEQLEESQVVFSRWTKDLNPWAVGCYTSMARVKNKHRRLESTYFLTEKMVTHAVLAGLVSYPRKALHEALEDLLFCQFHDSLPGSSISEVEEDVLQRMDHGLQILSRLKSEAFFRLLSGQPQAKDREFPLFVYNPHPFPVTETVICEFQPHEPNFNPAVFWKPELVDEAGQSLPLQLEKESSNISIDQRKRVVFRAELKPSQMNRFSCRLRVVDPPSSSDRIESKSLVFQTEALEVAIDSQTGLIEKYRVCGQDFLNPESFRLIVNKDYPDPWGMLVRSFREVEGVFTLMSKEQSAWFSGVSAKELEPIRIIEDGPIRTVIEALFQYRSSFACLTYTIPKEGTELEITVRVLWSEKDRMLKLGVPTVFTDGACKGQVAYGVEDFLRSAEELVAQKWVAVVSADDLWAFTVINEGTYGFDYDDGELRLSLLRSPAYSGHPVGSKPIVPQDRFQPRIDQGERVFRFWINGGQAEKRLLRIDREALVKNEKPMTLCCFPAGGGKKPLPGILLDDDSVQLTSFKLAEKRDWLIMRLFEPTGRKRSTRVKIPSLDLFFDVPLKKFEIKTLALNLKTKKFFETDLLERRGDD